MEGPAIFEVLDNLSIELWVIFPNSFHKLAAPWHQIHRTVGVKWISRTKTRMVCQFHRYVGEEFPCCAFYVIFSGTVRQNRLVYYPMNHHVQNLATRLRRVGEASAGLSSGILERERLATWTVLQPSFDCSPLALIAALRPDFLLGRGAG